MPAEQHSSSSHHARIHIGAERVVLDELAARLDHVAHQLGEDVVGVNLLDLQQRALVGIECGLPELARVNFAESFIAFALPPCPLRMSNRLSNDSVA
jgi:hypothetical protein